MSSECKCEKYCDLTFSNGSSFFTKRFDCDSWQCPACRLDKRAGWSAHLKRIVKELPRMWTFTVDADDWQSTYQRINRRGGHYIAIDDNYGCLIVFVDVLIDGAQGMTGPRAAVLISEAISEAGISPSGRRPVRTCYDWKMPARVSKGFTLVCAGKSAALVRKIGIEFGAAIGGAFIGISELPWNTILDLAKKLYFTKTERDLPKSRSRGKFYTFPKWMDDPELLWEPNCNFT